MARLTGHSEDEKCYLSGYIFGARRCLFGEFRVLIPVPAVFRLIFAHIRRDRLICQVDQPLPAISNRTFPLVYTNSWQLCEFIYILYGFQHFLVCTHGTLEFADFVRY